MEYKYSGGYSDDTYGGRDDGYVYCFRVIGDTMNTEIKVGWGSMGCDNESLYLDRRIPFENIEEIQSVIRYGVKMYKEQIEVNKCLNRHHFGNNSLEEV